MDFQLGTPVATAGAVQTMSDHGISPEGRDSIMSQERDISEDWPDLTPAAIQYLYHTLNWSQKKIGDHYGVTRAAINYYFSSGQVPKDPRQQLKGSFPWDVTGRWHTNAYPHKRLHDHAEFMATGGQDMTPGQLDKLFRFYRSLLNNN